jgi:hypothetical protein
VWTVSGACLALALLAPPAPAAGAPQPGGGLTILVDFDAHPIRVVRAYAESAAPEQLPERWAPEPAAAPEPTFVAVAVEWSGVRAFDLGPRPASFHDRLEGGSLSGDVSSARDVRLVHLPAARALLLGEARAATEGAVPTLAAVSVVLLDPQLPVSSLSDRLKSLGASFFGAAPVVPTTPPGGSGPGPKPVPERIAGARSPDKAFDIVVLADGFTTGELPGLRTRLAGFADRLLGTGGQAGIAPFSDAGVAELVSIHFVPTASKDSGITFCPCCATDWRDTHYGVRGNFRELGSPTDLDVEDYGPLHDAAALVAPLSQLEVFLMVVNCNEYGGRGLRGVRTAFVPLQEDDDELAELAVHELSHAAADLGDEYPACASERQIGRSFCNVATPSQLAAGPIWWTKLAYGSELDAKNELAIRHHCGDPAAPKAPADALGLFWGSMFTDLPAAPCDCSDADGRRCGYYRPQANCKMREQWEPFCRACAHSLRELVRLAALGPTGEREDTFGAFCHAPRARVKASP